jgi:hypothetical protein
MSAAIQHANTEEKAGPLGDYKQDSTTFTLSMTHGIIDPHTLSAFFS